MFMRIRTAARLCILLVALCAGQSGRAGPFVERGPEMAKEKDAPAARPEQAHQEVADKRLVTIPLRLLPNPAKQADEFGNRFPAQYQAINLGDLRDSIRIRGLLDPPVVARGKDGQWRIIGGHRRVATLYDLAESGAPGFSLDMPVVCLERVGASQLDLVIHSIAGNELAKRLDVKERLLAVQKASAAGATRKEIAAAVGVSDKAIDRDLKIANNPRVLRHVLDDDLPPSAASALVEVAVKAKRLDEFLDHFDVWAQLTKEVIEEADRRAKQERGKGLKPNEALVANRLEAHIVRGWLEALAKGKPLTEEPGLGFEAAFDKKTAVATIKVKVDAKNDDPEHLARVAGQVSQVAKHLAAFARKRRELEGPAGPQAALKDDALLDTDLLKEYGLEDVAVGLENELRAGDKPFDDPAPQ
jgi:ParB-like chromosome segregation protein Spo0J